MDEHKPFYERYAAVALIVVVAVGYFLWQQGYFGKKVVYTPENTPNKALETKDASFRQAQTLARMGKYDEAAPLYQESLAHAGDAAQKAQVLYKIASMADLSGNTEQAISQYKKLATDTSITPQIRAYAVLMLGRMYILRPQDSLNTAIFTGESFQKMAEGVDREAAYKNLFEYSASLYPLALSELYSARWYANQLVLSKEKKITLTDAEKADYLRTVKQKFDLARTDANRMVKDPNESIHLAVAAAITAQVRSQLFFAGNDTEQGVHDAYARALSLILVYNRPTDDGQIRMRYGIFLMKVGGEKNLLKMSQILGPIYSDAYANSFLTSYLKMLPSVASTTPEYADIVALAKKAPEFKALLEKHGWQDSDFK